MNNETLSAQKLAALIGCDRSTIFNYINKGLPYEAGYITGNGLVNRKIKVFNKEVALKWLSENGSEIIRERVGGIQNV